MRIKLNEIILQHWFILVLSINTVYVLAVAYKPIRVETI